MKHKGSDEQEEIHKGATSTDQGQDSSQGPIDTQHQKPPKEKKEEGQNNVSIDDSNHELEDLREQHLRLLAEFENYKKRSARELNQIRARTSENVIRNFLPFVDDLERAADSITIDGENVASIPAIKEGIDLVLKSISEKMENLGLHIIQTQGKLFNPELHEAVMVAETEDHPENTIINEVQKGYSMGDRVIRPSRVVVAKAITKGEETRGGLRPNGTDDSI